MASSSNNLTNIAAANAAAQAANMAAQQEYLRMRLYLLEIPEMQIKSLADQDNIAFQWAQFAWQTGFQTASLTGKIPAGGLQLQMPSVDVLRQSYGVNTTPAPTTYTAGALGGGGGGSASGGSPQSVMSAIMATGKQAIGGLPLSNPGSLTSGDVEAWFRNLADEPHSELNGGGYNLADFKGVADAARAAGFNMSYYDSKVQPAQQQAQAQTPAGTTGALGQTPQNPFGQINLGTGGTPGSSADLDIPGIGPGETPTLDYIKLMASLTGQLAGKPTLEAQIAQGNVGGMPSLEAQQLAGWVSPVQNWREAGPWGESGWYDQYGNPLLMASQGGNPSTKPYDMIPTLQREQIMAELSGYMPGPNGTVGTTPTLARESEYNSRAVQLLQLAASLQQDPFRMAITLGQTPNGLTDILNAASGRLNLPGYTAGTQGQPMDLATFAGDVQSLAGNPIQTTPTHVQAPTGAYNYEVNQNGSLNTYPPGTTAPENRTQVNSTTPLSYKDAIQQAMQSVPYTAPSQVAPQAYNDMQPTQQKLLWQSYQMSGLSPEAAEASYKASLPKYAAQDPTGRVLLENR